ncbi:MAG: SRPBCC family protein [Tepidisphaerales bacterium]
MPVLQFECEVPAPLEKVWAWHDDILTALPALSPPEDDVRLEYARPLPPRVGTEVLITARGPLGRRLRWLARYTAYAPPHGVTTGMEARFVDEQVSGPFARWRHHHEFEALTDTTTRLVDRIEYAPPLWPLSFPADLLLIRPKLRAMFAHRHRVLRQVFASPRAGVGPGVVDLGVRASAAG